MGVKMSFCPKCGAERKVGSRFCHNCGYEFLIDDSSGENQNLSNLQLEQSTADVNPQINQNPNSNVQNDQKSHTVAMVLGYIFSVLIPLFGFIFGIYLYRCDEEDAKKNGKIIIGISIIVWILSFIAMRM